jgi:uncharacterized protein YoxC
MIAKKACLFLVLVCLIGFVSSLSINIDSPLSQGQQWSIQASLSSLSNGDVARVFLGSEQVFVATKIDNDFLKVSSSSRVINSILNNNGELTLVLTGLSSGSYNVKIESNNDSVEAVVIFFEPVSKSDQDKLISRINNLESEISNLESELASSKIETSSLQEKIVSLEKELELKNSQITKLISDNSSIDSSLKSLDSKLRLLEQEGKTNEEIVNELKNDLNVLLEEREAARNTPVAGLFAFGAQNSGLLLGLFALVALVIAGVFIKSRTGSIYSSSLFGDDDVAPEIEPVEADETSLNETKISPFQSIFSNLKKKVSSNDSSKETVKKKKWAVEPYHGENETPNKSNDDSKEFSLSDLTKK